MYYQKVNWVRCNIILYCKPGIAQVNQTHKSELNTDFAGIHRSKYQMPIHYNTLKTKQNTPSFIAYCIIDES